jgi:hypothetical protein
MEMRHRRDTGETGQAATLPDNIQTNCCPSTSHAKTARTRGPPVRDAWAPARLGRS